MDKNRLEKGLGRAPSINLESRVSENSLGMRLWVKFVYMKYECPLNFLSIRYRMNAPCKDMTMCYLSNAFGLVA